MGGGGTTECARPGCPKNGTRTIPATLFSSNRAKVCKACYTWMRRHFQVEPNGKHVRCADHGTLPRCATMLQAFASTGIYPVQCSNTNLTKGISLPAGSTSLPPPPTKAAATRTSGRRGTTVARRGRKRAATSRASRTPRAAPGRRRRSNSGSSKVDDDEDYEPEDGVVDEASSDDDARAGAVSSSDDSEWGSEVDEDTELEDVHYHHHHHHFHATNSHSRSRRRGAGGRNTTATSSTSSSAPTPATVRGASRNTATPGLGTDAAGLNGGFYTGVDSAAMDAAYDSIMFDGPLAFGDAMNEDLELDVFSPASGSVRSSGGGALASPPTATPGTRASVTSAGYPMASPTGGYSAVTHKTSAKRVPKLQAPPPPRSNNSNSSGWGSQLPSLAQSALEESWTGAPAAPPISEMEWDEAALPGAGIGMLSPFLLGDQTDSVTASLLEPRQETGGAAPPPPPPSSQAMQRAPSHTPTPMRRSGMAQLGFMTRVNSSGSMASVSGLGLPQPTTLTPRASPAPYVSGLRATGSSSSSSSFASGPRASPPDVLDSIIVMPDYYRSDRMPGDIGGGDVDDEDWDMSSVSADEGPENRSSSSSSAAWPAGIIRSATPAGVSSSSATVQFYRTLVISFHQVAASGAARAAAEARLAAGKCANASCSNAATTTLPRGVLELTCAGEPRVCSSCAAWAAHHFGMPAPVAAAAAAKVASTVVGCEGNTECRHPTCATRLRAMATSGFVLFHAASPTPAASPGGPSPLASPTSAASGLVTTPYRLLDRLGFGRGPYDDGFTLTTIGSTSTSSTSATSASMSSSGAGLYSTSAPSTTGGGFGSGAMVPRHRDLRKYEVRHCVHATGLRGSLLRVSSLGAAARAGAGALHDAGATYQCTVCFKKLRPCSACGEALVGSYARTHPGCKSTTTKSSLNLPLGQHNTVGGELSDVSAMEAAIGQL